MRQLFTKLYVFAAIMATALLVSCQQESDEVFGNIDGLGLDGQAYNYTGMWDVLWNGFNQNYVGWENETIDWDEVNAVTRPKLVALDAKYDTLYNQGKLSSDSTAGKAVAEAAKQLFHAAFDSLHDGHTKVQYKDPYTMQYELIHPVDLRIKQRGDYGSDWKFKPLDKRYFVEQRDIVRDSIKTFNGDNIAREILMDSILPKMQYDATQLVPTKEDVANYKKKLEYCANLIKQINERSNNDSDFYKLFKNKISSNTSFDDINVKYALYNIGELASMQMFFTTDNIAYFWLSSFSDWPYNQSGNIFNQNGYIERIFWSMIYDWHAQVYKLHAEKKLKGVVLDVRGNNGGDAPNLNYFAGLLFKGDKWQIGTQKTKNGIGRLDYTPSMPFYFPCCGENSEDITEPIVILTNIASASCAELTTAAVKTHENGKSIGSRTAGAGAAVYPDGTYYSKLNYSGTIGSIEEGRETNVYARIPMEVTNFGGGIGNIECKGITPDIEVPLDHDLYNNAGHDTQFERALKYIREGK